MNTDNLLPAMTAKECAEMNATSYKIVGEFLVTEHGESPELSDKEKLIVRESAWIKYKVLAGYIAAGRRTIRAMR
jgi:hypothetical protein